MSDSISRQSPVPCNHQTEITIGKYDSYNFSRLNPRKLLEHLRILLSKAWYEETNFSKLDHSYLLIVWDQILEIKDLTFLTRHKMKLKEADFALRVLRTEGSLKTSCPIKDTDRTLKRRRKDLSKNKILLAPRSYFGMKKLFNTIDQFKRINRRIRARTKPVRFLGVGYKDKGARRNESVDATPAWQEVASQSSNNLLFEDCRTKQLEFWRSRIFLLTLADRFKVT